jgi:hypothetical protein
MSTPSNVYQPSGEKGEALWQMPLIAIPVIFLLSILYGYVSVYNPLAGVISFIFPIGYGGAIALTLFIAGQYAQCRNENLMVGLSLACGILALYLAWASFLCVTYNCYAPPDEVSAGMWEVLIQPLAMWDFTCEINETGWFWLEDIAPSGFILWIFWLCEAAIIVGMITWIPNFLLRNCVYCERCFRWCVEKKNIARFAVPDSSSDLAGRIKKGDILALTGLGEEPIGLGFNYTFLRLDSQRCEKCGDTGTFQVVHVFHRIKDGKETESETKWTELMVLNRISLQAFNAARAQ